MGIFIDAKGTTRNQFAIKNALIDASLLTSAKTITLPNANINFSGGASGNVLTQDGGGNWAPAAPTGGGGYTEIAASGNITGTYQGNVHCLGDVTMTGNVTVRGTLYVEGKFITAGDYSLTVDGDFIVKKIIDGVATSGKNHGNFTIYGNCYLGEDQDIATLSAISTTGIQHYELMQVTNSVNAQGRAVTVGTVTNNSSFDISDSYGSLTLTSIAAPGDIIRDGSGEERVIATLTATHVTTTAPFTNTPAGTMYLNYYGFFETMNSVSGWDLMSSGLFSVGDHIDFYEGTAYHESLPIASFGWDSAGSNNWYFVMTGNYTQPLSGQSAHLCSRNMGYYNSGMPPGFVWGGGDTVYFIGSGEAVSGESATFGSSTSFGFGPYDNYFKFSSEFSQYLPNTSVFAKSAKTKIVLTSGQTQWNGKTFTWSPGSANAGDSVTLTYVGSYSDDFVNGEEYNMTPTQTDAALMNDTLDYDISIGSSLQSNLAQAVPGDFYVGGDLFTRSLELSPLADQRGVDLTVKGDMIGFKGVYDEYYNNLFVRTSAYRTSYCITTAKRGGHITVQGKVQNLSLYTLGGFAQNPSTVGGGAGGDIHLGSFIGANWYKPTALYSYPYDSSSGNEYIGNEILCQGGYSMVSGQNAGDAGRFVCQGDCICRYFLLIGGDKTTNTGKGGDMHAFYVGGTFVCTYKGQMNPGLSYAGTTAIWNEPPVFGGDVIIKIFSIGQAAALLSSSWDIASSTHIKVCGDLRGITGPSGLNYAALYLYANNSYEVSQYASTYNTGGAQPTTNSIFIEGNALIGTLSSCSESNTVANIMNSGDIKILGNCACFYMYAEGFKGGNGGYIQIHGNVRGEISGVPEISVSAADSNNTLGGGGGGIINIYGNAVALLRSKGCTRTSGTIAGGPGGGIVVWGNLDGGVNTRGGVGRGAAGGAAGNVTIHGNFTSILQLPMECYGGNATVSGNFAGGKGGDITVYGTVHIVYPSGAATINAYGGNGIGSGVGGNSGVLDFYGQVLVNNINAYGGNSPSGTAGQAANCTFRNGCQIINAQIVKDGTGVAPANTAMLRLGGPCCFNTINVTNRAGCTIRPLDITGAAAMTPVTFIATTLSGKNVLTHTAGNTAAYINTNLYFATNGVWYRAAGVAA